MLDIKSLFESALTTQLDESMGTLKPLASDPAIQRFFAKMMKDYKYGLTNKSQFVLVPDLSVNSVVAELNRVSKKANVHGIMFKMGAHRQVYFEFNKDETKFSKSTEVRIINPILGSIDQILTLSKAMQGYVDDSDGGQAYIITRDMSQFDLRKDRAIAKGVTDTLAVSNVGFKDEGTFLMQKLRKQADEMRNNKRIILKPDMALKDFVNRLQTLARSNSLTATFEATSITGEQEEFFTADIHVSDKIKLDELIAGKVVIGTALSAVNRKMWSFVYDIDKGTIRAKKTF